jgi:hypothetical protein
VPVQVVDDASPIGTVKVSTVVNHAMPCGCPLLMEVRSGSGVSIVGKDSPGGTGMVATETGPGPVNGPEEPYGTAQTEGVVSLRMVTVVAATVAVLTM